MFFSYGIWFIFALFEAKNKNKWHETTIVLCIVSVHVFELCPFFFFFAFLFLVFIVWQFFDKTNSTKKGKLHQVVSSAC